MNNNNSILLFAKALAGKYSNKEQAEKNPRDFAHINVYYRPLEWSIFNGPFFYSEQSFDYDPWSPYRQSIHQISKSGDIFIVTNYSLKNPKRIAGSGFMPDLLNGNALTEVSKRNGCSMHFTKIGESHYKGSVEPGNKCLIKRDGLTTFLASNVEIKKESMTSLDEGFEIRSKKKIWGSENGSIQFKKFEVLGFDVISNWTKIFEHENHSKLEFKS